MGQHHRGEVLLLHETVQNIRRSVSFSSLRAKRDRDVESQASVTLWNHERSGSEWLGLVSLPTGLALLLPRMAREKRCAQMTWKVWPVSTSIGGFGAVQLVSQTIQS